MEITTELRAQLRKTLADMEAARKVPVAEFPGHKGVYLANLEGFLGRFTIPLLDALEQAEAAAPTVPVEEVERLRTALLFLVEKAESYEAEAEPPNQSEADELHLAAFDVAEEAFLAAIKRARAALSSPDPKQEPE